MEENHNKKKNTLTILGLVALIIVMFIGIKGVFAGLDAAIPDLKYMGAQNEQSQSASSSAPSASAEAEETAPAFCPYCGEKMRDGFQWGQFCPFCGEKVE